MFLKSLEMTGFKSFAEKTRLDFEPGLTAVVGPNGCGKSNIADAVRWVLGEQSAKALRGHKMEDCIFNGTDSRKPLGMAEVNITFADCEEILGTDFHEVTLTRRVFRSGEGQYFINKAPCRLKDIQRLFMDTGVGTTSYSLFEQGRIDLILSAHPEDRRAIFEEASGITKFKSDKKEAIRKLDHTEANLLRLADVLREVKRQIGSLQRQAGKARRYKALQDELRGLDLVAARDRLTHLESRLREVEARKAELDARLTVTGEELLQVETDVAARRDAMTELERDLSAIQEADVRTSSERDHTRRLIETNAQRIAEYETWSQRDTREIAETRRQIDEKQALLQQLRAQREDAQSQDRVARERLQAGNAELEEHREQTRQTRQRIQALREEAVENESLLARLQNEMVELEAHERDALIRRERLAAEKAQFQRVVANFTARRKDMDDALTALRQNCDRSAKELAEREEQQRTNASQLQASHRELARLESRAAACEAQTELLDDRSGPDENDYPGGARLLLDPANPLGIETGTVLGALASYLSAEPDFSLALEACLRAWADAVLVTHDAAARTILDRIRETQAGAVRLLTGGSAARATPPCPAGAERLIDHVRAAPEVRPVLEALIGHVCVVDSLEDVPAGVAAGVVCVTRDGLLAADGTFFEFWPGDDPTANPLARRHRLDDVQRELAACRDEAERVRKELAALEQQRDEVERETRAARQRLDRQRHEAAQKEGEQQVVQSESDEARQRLETVTWELENLNGEGRSGEEARRSIAERMEQLHAQRETCATAVRTLTAELHERESRLTELQAEVAERRIAAAGIEQKLTHLASQEQAVSVQTSELQSLMEGRSEGLLSYRQSIERLTVETAEARERVLVLETEAERHRAKAAALRIRQEELSADLRRATDTVTRKREAVEALRTEKSEVDILRTEENMRRRTLLERLAADYNLTEEQLAAQPEPDWEGSRPSLDEMDTRIAELKTKLDAMGPVNLVAIEEYRELEERYRFLTEQEADLTTARQQLLDLIRKINRTTSEMFRATFERVNANFQEIFARLFAGGSARLVLVNEEDVLECGIEIIARPPGKRLQNVSLLSGGERTLTAVALLFSIYLIKPSPFCLLDELDAALDESNIGRFVSVLQEFLAQSQFLVITHNRQTIAAAETLYGITMPERGVSRIVSMRFREYDRSTELAEVPSDA